MSRNRSHRVRNIILAVAGAIAGIIVIVAVAASNGDSGNSSTPPAASVGPDKVCFAVTGTGQPSISYGSDSDSRDAGGHLGALSDGNALPWRACMPANRSAMYWTVTAQLQGGGHITATVAEVRPDGTSKTLATARASGGYQIANAEYTGWVGP